MSSTETYKPQWDLQNLSKLDPDLKQIALQPTTTYTSPTYTFDVTPNATASISAKDHLVQCTVGVFGPRPYISTAVFTEHGVVTCEIMYASYARHHINAVATPPAPNKGQPQRATPQELEMATILQDLLSSSIQLAQIPKHEVFISVAVQQSSGCQWYDLTFIANAVSAALATSGISLYDMVSAATVYLLPNVDCVMDQITKEKQQSTTTTTQPQYCLSVYPPTPLLLNIISQSAINYNPISMTVSYLPSLQQITFSKLQGQLQNNASIIASLHANLPSGAQVSSTTQSPWSLLTHSSVELCKLINQQQKTTIKTQYVNAAMGLMTQERDDGDDMEDVDESQ